MVCHLYIRIQSRTDAQVDIRTLILHGIFGIDSHQSTLRILPIKRALRTTHNIHAVNHIEMIIKCRLRHQRNVVVIHADSRIIDA